jgi:hypothetical protein
MQQGDESHLLKMRIEAGEATDTGIAHDDKAATVGDAVRDKVNRPGFRGGWLV